MTELGNATVPERPNRNADGWRESVYGLFPTDFHEATLGSLCNDGDGIQTGPFGSQLHQRDYVATGTPIITVEHLGDNRVIHRDMPYVSDHDKDRLSKYILHEGDIVFSRVGSVDRRVLVQPTEEGWLFSGRCIRVRPDISKIDPAYLSYFFAMPEFKEYIRSIAVGATMPSLNTKILRELPILYPPLPEQRRIARILGTLDDKIELNRRMNRTLEEMARALFKSWFVDLAPVRAKMDGRWRRGQSLPGLPADLYDLFPDRLIPSELGEIPAGWEVKALGDELKTLVSGSRPRGGAVDAGIPSIGAENVNGIGRHDYSKEKYIPEAFFDRMKTKGAAVQNGDVLLYKDGARIGRKTYLDCGYPYSDCAVNEHVFILRLKNRDAQKYLFFWLDQNWMTQEIISLNSNSAQPGINQKGVRSLPFMVPSDQALAAFNLQIGDMTDRIFANCHESNALSGLRNTLLPKLVSGDVKVNSF